MTMGSMQNLNYPQLRQVGKVTSNGFGSSAPFSLPQVLGMTLFIPHEPGNTRLAAAALLLAFDWLRIEAHARQARFHKRADVAVVAAVRGG